MDAWRPFDGEWGLILGASSGFGAATARELGRLGMGILGVHLGGGRPILLGNGPDGGIQAGRCLRADWLGLDRRIDLGRLGALGWLGDLGWLGCLQWINEFVFGQRRSERLQRVKGA